MSSNLFEAADARAYERAIQRAAWAPKGQKLKRQAELRKLVEAMLEQETARAA